MTDNQLTERLEMRWLPVTTADGRTHMECVWVQVRPATTIAHAA